MSWLARSIANTLSLNDDDQEDSGELPNPNDIYQEPNNDTSSPSTPSGVKEDFSELTKTLTRQLWGVASFLAPPPQQELNEASKPDPNESVWVGIAGIRSDFAEIGGKFKSGISKLSDNINVSEITRMASNFLQLAEAEEGGGFDSAAAAATATATAVGVSEQVVAFARDIAMHPETWLDFPLPEDQDDDDDDEDFDLTDAQQEHALAVERLAPRLAALRFELCPAYMSERQFWKIYFVLLHPRLDKEDALLLSTPQIMKARAFLAAELQSRKRATIEGHVNQKGSESSQHGESLAELSSDTPGDALQTTSVLESASSTVAADPETEKHTITSTEIPMVDKSVIEEGHVNQNKYQSVHSASGHVWEKEDEDDNDDWLREETLETGAASGTTIPIDNGEDVSFSDLEEEEGDEPTSFNKVNYTSDKDSRNWVELRKSNVDSSEDIKSVIEPAKVNYQHPENKESNDWLDVDDIDVA